MPGLLVTGNYFQVLGARPLISRTLLPGDAIAPGSQAVAVLSEWAWRSRFGADPAILGKRIPLGRQSFEIVGVIRHGMALPGQQSLGFWAPMTMARAFAVSAMMNETLKVALIGLTTGLALAIAAMRGLNALSEIIPKFGLRPYVVGVLIVLTATMVAALLPSLRASRIDPSKALRAE